MKRKQPVHAQQRRCDLQPCPALEICFEATVHHPLQVRMQADGRLVAAGLQAAPRYKVHAPYSVLLAPPVLLILNTGCQGLRSALPRILFFLPTDPTCNEC